MVTGALSGSGYGLWRYLSEESPFESGLLPSLKEATPFAALLIALVVAIDQLLMATAKVARPGVEKSQADAYAMLRSVVPSALAAASAGYLTVAIGAGQSWVIIGVVVALGLLGSAIVTLALRLSATDVSTHISWRRTAFLVAMIPLAVAALGVTIST